MQRPVLDRFIERIDLFEPEAGLTHRRFDFLPDGKTRLVFRWLGEGQGDLSVRGPWQQAHYKVAPVLPLTAAVVFRAGGAYPFFGTPLDALVDDRVLLSELWACEADRLLERLIATARRAGDIGCVLEEALVDRLRCRPFDPPGSVASRAAVGLMNEGERRFDDVAAVVGVSQRHLRRSFAATVGLSPKTYARIARFQRALRLKSEGSWSSIARAAGYFDQAHLIGEFRELALRAPGSLDDESAITRFHC